MRDSTIARNYAEALLALATKAGNAEGWGRLIRNIADEMAQDVRLGNFMRAPQVSAEQRKAVLRKSFADRLPAMMVRFLEKLVDNRRQALIPAIAVEYEGLLDEVIGRVHATVTLARTPADGEMDAIAAQLSARMGRTVVPHVTVNADIIGGVIVRFGDTVMDGSVRKRLAVLRSRLGTIR